MTKTPLRYAGGKTRAYKLITPYVEKYDKIVSPFLGGGSMEVQWASNKEVIGYDVFDILTTFWNTLINRKEELIEELIKIEPSKEKFNKLKNLISTDYRVQSLYKLHITDHYLNKYNSEVIKLDDVKLSAYYYYLHNTSYGPGFPGFASSVYTNKTKWENMISRIKKSNIDMKVFNKPFEESIPLHNDDFLYLDPPYYLKKESDNKMTNGLYPGPNVRVHHDGFDHEKLRDLLYDHKGDFVLSYNNCETIREWYKDYEIFYPKWSYSYSNNHNLKESHEILIVKR
jgi:DNA adenine methylase